MALEGDAAPVAGMPEVLTRLGDRGHERLVPGLRASWCAHSTRNMLENTAAPASGQHLNTSADRLSGPIAFFHWARLRTPSSVTGLKAWAWAESTASVGLAWAEKASTGASSGAWNSSEQNWPKAASDGVRPPQAQFGRKPSGQLGLGHHEVDRDGGCDRPIFVGASEKCQHAMRRRRLGSGGWPVAPTPMSASRRANTVSHSRLPRRRPAAGPLGTVHRRRGRGTGVPSSNGRGRVPA